MAVNLTRTLLGTHLAPNQRRAGLPPAGGEVDLTIDHVALEEEDALLALLALRAAGRTPAGPDALLAFERNGLAAGPEVIEEQRALEYLARSAGMARSRFGNGQLAGVYLARLATPGKSVLGPRGRLAPFGALAMLAGSAGATELAAVLAGAPYPTRVPEVVGVWLRGTLPDWTSGADVALTLARRASAGGPLLRMYEFTGPGVASLGIDDRLAVARGSARWCGGRALLPSDAVTRAFLAAEGRDTDWRALAPPADAEYDRELELDLSVLEPQVWSGNRGTVLPVGAVAGARIDGVVLGADAGVEDLERLATRLAGTRVAEAMRLVVIPGTREVHDTLATRGSLATLVGAGAELVEPSEAAAVLRLTEGARWLGCGVPVGALGRESSTLAFIAGPDVCAASAIAGAIRDPRERSLAEPRVPLARYESDASRIARDGAGEGEAPALPAPPRLSPVLETALRGVTLLTLPEGTPPGAVLPWGARTRPLRARVAELAQHAFAVVAPGFAERARAAGGGFLVWRGTFDSDGRGDETARVLAELGVRAVIARDFAFADRRALWLDGVLPLAVATPSDADRLAEGDELELPDLPDALAPRKPVVLRDLTRGTQMLLRHDLTAREIDHVRAGGLLGPPHEENGA
jgi:aconitate hydratase